MLLCDAFVSVNGGEVYLIFPFEQQLTIVGDMLDRLFLTLEPMPTHESIKCINEHFHRSILKLKAKSVSRAKIKSSVRAYPIVEIFYVRAKDSCHRSE